MVSDRDIVKKYIEAFEWLFRLDVPPKVKRVGDGVFKATWNNHRYPIRTRAYLIAETEHLRELASRNNG